MSTPDWTVGVDRVAPPTPEADELRKVVDQLEAVVAVIRAEAERMDIPAGMLRDASGGFVLAQPLSALAFARAALLTWDLS